MYKVRSVCMTKYSIRYGASLRKRHSKVKSQKIALYKCEICGKVEVERVGTGIWKCRNCKNTFAGGAYALTTAQGEIAKRLIEDLGHSGA